LMRMRKVNTWTRRSTEAWSGHSSNWRWRGRTSSSRYVCALVFKRLQGLRIGKRSSAYSCFSDADFAECRLDRKSTSGTCQFLGSSLVSWSSPKQSSLAQSTTEAEYVAATSCCSQLLWITYTMSDFGEDYTHVPLQCDSTSAISVAKNPVLHSKTKHIEVRYHFLREHREREDSFDPWTHTWPTSRYFHQTPRSSNFHSFAGELAVCLISWVGCVGAPL
jgi:hypothetical protein